MGISETDFATFCNISGFGSAEAEILSRVAKQVIPHIPELTDRFYEILARDELTAPYLRQSSLALLKNTHIDWMTELFCGNLDEEFISRQTRIGETHVRFRIPPIFVAASMSFLRAALPAVILQKVPDRSEASRAVAALLRLLDLCHYLIDSSYNDALMDNLGVSPALLVRLRTVVARPYLGA